MRIPNLIHRNAREQDIFPFLISHPLLLNCFSPSRNFSPPCFPPLINPKYRTRQNHQSYQISQANRLRLKHRLQERHVNHQKLADERRRHRKIEEFVGEEA